MDCKQPACYNHQPPPPPPSFILVADILIILGPRPEVDDVQTHTYLMMTLSLLAGSFPQGPLIWKQLSFPEVKKDHLR